MRLRRVRQLRILPSFKSARKITRTSDHEIPSATPCFRLCYDLIQMAPGYNGYQYVSHFICDHSGLHRVWIHRFKYEILKIIETMFELAKNHHKMPISVIHLDGETSL